MLKIAMTAYDSEEIVDDVVQETLIKCGVENNLGKLASKLFRLPGRYISISNYSVDIERRELTLFGSCSSDTMPMKNDFKIIMDVRPELELRTETRVYKNSFDGEYKWRKSCFFIDAFFYP